MYLKGIEPREYQEVISKSALDKNTIVVVPTGMGKTLIFVMVALERMRQFPDKKIVLLGPTRPLISQYKAVFEKSTTISPDEMVILTGNIKQENRIQLWHDHRIIFSTPQGLDNDVNNGLVSLKDVCLIGFDESHRAVGNYAYVNLAEVYKKQSETFKITAMTASPGATKPKILEVVKNLFIEHIEVRTEDDPDVKPYIQNVEKVWVEVELTEEIKCMRTHFETVYKKNLQIMMDCAVVNIESVSTVTKGDLVGFQKFLFGKMQGCRDSNVFTTISACAAALKIQHALELLESQGLNQLSQYCVELGKQKAKASIKLVADSNFQFACNLLNESIAKGVEHPKIIKLAEILPEKVQNNGKLIIFTQYRGSAAAIVKKLMPIPGINPGLFVGQQKKGGMGMSQKEQLEMLKDFDAGKYNILIMTSVGEEGLDITKVDEVIFYEPVPSAIRKIQRSGRTGRLEKGMVTTLIAKGTRDEGYRWSAYHKEKQMYRAIEQIKWELTHKDVPMPREPLDIGAIPDPETMLVKETTITDYF